MVERASRGKDSTRNSPNWRAQFVPRWVRTWSLHNPTWEHRMWDEAMILKLAQELGYLHLIQSFSERIKKIDLARYMILSKHGGVVLDVDFEAFKPIGELLEGRSVVLIEESENQSINCAWIASIPNHPLWSRVMDEIKSRQATHSRHGVMFITGPKMLTDVSNEWVQEAVQEGTAESAERNKLHILRHATGENRLFYPYHADHMIDASNREKMSSSCSVTNTCARMYPNSIAMHHFAATW